MKKQLWQKAIVGTLLATSLATPIALAQTTDSLNTTSAGQAQLVDHRGEGGKGWREERRGPHFDERRQGKHRFRGDERSWRMNGFQRGPSSVSLGLLHMQEDLNLSEEQINRLEETAQQSQREMITLRSQRKLMQLDQRQLMQQETFDQEALQKHNQQMADLHLKMANLRTTELGTVHQILTPTQWKQWKEQQPRQRGMWQRGMRDHSMRHKERDDDRRSRWQHGKSESNAEHDAT
ncbi:MAG: Spy/CpxP family protein refolding chaperone [Deltaproteobacteria bacterium]|jgi:Spy/CpxP family protein refolding chaperone